MNASPRFRRRWPLQDRPENRPDDRAEDRPEAEPQSRRDDHPAVRGDDPQQAATAPEQPRPPRARLVRKRRKQVLTVAAEPRSDRDDGRMGAGPAAPPIGSASPGPLLLTAPAPEDAADSAPGSTQAAAFAPPAPEGADPSPRRVRLAALPKAKVAKVLRRVREQDPAAGRPTPESTADAPAHQAAPTAAPAFREGGAAADPSPPAQEGAVPSALPEIAPCADQSDRAKTLIRDATPAPPHTPPAPAPEASAGPPADRAPAQPVGSRTASGVDRYTPLWEELGRFEAASAHLDRHRVISARREDPAHAAFDMLRTRLLQALADHGWKRVAITSPTARCGKTFTAANLAVSLSRQENCRTVLLDLDLRRPSLHATLGHHDPAPIGDMLRGEVAPARHLLRLGQNDFDGGHNLAIGFNSRREPYAAELMQDPRTAETLGRIETDLSPDVMLFDLPPVLYTDDVMALRPHFDGVILVVGGGITTPKEVKSVERRLGERVPLLGMVLNMSEDSDVRHYPD